MQLRVRLALTRTVSSYEATQHTVHGLGFPFPIFLADLDFS